MESSAMAGSFYGNRYIMHADLEYGLCMALRGTSEWPSCIMEFWANDKSISQI
jgi:hypothetical protein